MRTVLIVIGLGLVLTGGLWWRHSHPAHAAPVNASIYETDMVASLVRNILAEFKPPLPSVCFLAFGDGTTRPARSLSRVLPIASRRCRAAVPPRRRRSDNRLRPPPAVRGWWFTSSASRNSPPAPLTWRCPSPICRPATTALPTGSSTSAANGRSKAANRTEPERRSWGACQPPSNRAYLVNPYTLSNWPIAARKASSSAACRSGCRIWPPPTSRT